MKIPWLAGGHNGLSNAEDPLMPEDPYPARQGPARRTMKEEAAFRTSVPIVMAGGVWYLRDWNDWIDNPGTRRHCVPVRHAARC
jgi:hypothetical protein